jgi:hypothetical protein
LHLLNAPGGSMLAPGPLDRPERLVRLPESYAQMLRAADEVNHRDRLLADDRPPTDWQALGERALPDDLAAAHRSRVAGRVQDDRDQDQDRSAILSQLIEAS